MPTGIAKIAPRLVSLPSASFNKAYLVEGYFPHSLAPLTTDPVTTVSPSQPSLPLVGNFTIPVVVVDTRRVAMATYNFIRR